MRKEYYEANRDAILAKKRQRYLDDPAYAEAARERARAVPPEKAAQASKQYYRKNRELVLDRNRQWRANNPEKYAEVHRATEARRRARKQGAQCTPATTSEIRTLAASCAVCGYGQLLELDHIVPISRGGCSAMHNLQNLCAQHNRAKHSKTMAEWLAPREFSEWLSAAPSAGCPVAEAV
jgi:5-methylcytosine-specific restriction endonuclease McrA